MPAVWVSGPCFAYRRAGGPQVAAEISLGAFWIFADAAPVLEGGVKHIDVDLIGRAELALLAHESADRGGEVAHLRDCVVSGFEPGEMVLVVEREPPQAIERPVENAGQL